jgi:tripartite-type tricarboxylate transporter receptor subunit TctC
MKLPRRQFLHLAAGAAALPTVSRIARAQTYPTRPVRIVVAFAPGGPADILARVVGQWLSERLGQPFIVAIRPGAGGNIGTEEVARADADGYTLLMAGPSNAIGASLYDNLKFDFLRDIAAIAGIIRFPSVMLSNLLVPARTVSEFIAYAKANPGKLKMASGGSGTSTHVAGELFNMMAGIKMEHVAYRGGPDATAAVIEGRAQVIFHLTASSMEPISTGKLRPLAVTGVVRSDVLPDVPTIGESVFGYEASAVYGLSAPAGTPTDIIGRLNNVINAGLADPGLKAQLESMGGTVMFGSPADFGRLFAEETEKWGKVVKFAGLKPE